MEDQGFEVQGGLPAAWVMQREIHYSIDEVDMSLIQPVPGAGAL
jgi:hypothetical protein